MYDDYQSFHPFVIVLRSSATFTVYLKCPRSSFLIFLQFYSTISTIQEKRQISFRMACTYFKLSRRRGLGIMLNHITTQCLNSTAGYAAVL